MHNADHPFERRSQASGDAEGAIQSWLREKVGDLLGLEVEQIEVEMPFSEYGLVSADAVGLSGELAELVGRPLEPTIVYDYPTIAQLARYLAQPEMVAERADAAMELGDSTGGTEEAIAIIGMACRFPGGSTTPEAFWQLLSQGKNATGEIPARRWASEEYYDPAPDVPGKMYTRYGCFLDEIDGFDANLFGISPREALRMDPQQRLLIEVAWETVENAGLAMSSLAGSQTGVFVGMMNNSEYSQLQMQQGDDAYQNDPHFGTGSAASVASGRLAYLFDWQGPTLTVDTACSSSLVALHLACQSLRRRECTQALVGGVHTVLLPETMVNACKMGMLAVDGRCKTFDVSADGFVMGEGCGAVMLKPLTEALAAGNPVLAVIRGSAVNQDGRSNGMTAPNRLAQEAVIRRALARASVQPWEVDYVEAHGSGTALGDPIEIAALEAVFAEQREEQRPLLVGTVKTNIGHLVGAAGMAGLIKTVLALLHREIPPHLNLQEISPHVARVQRSTTIPRELTPWQSERSTRLAGVSSFGWSGTNAHVVLEEAPAVVSAAPSAYPAHLLVLSAHTETALNRATDNLAAFIQEHPEISLAQLASTLQTGRSSLQQRRVLVCREREETLTALRERTEKRVLTGVSSAARSVAFLLPGVGEQYVDLAQELYRYEAAFRETVDACCTLLKEQSGLDLRDTIFSHVDQTGSTSSNGKSAAAGQAGSAPSNGKSAAFPLREGIDLRRLLDRGVRTVSEAFERLKQTAMAQPAAFVIEYALACLLETWGIRPVAMLGYSLGEYVAACLAGVFSLEDALLLVAQRAKMIQGLPAGAMVAVFLSEQDVRPYLTREISLATINAPATCVLAGPVPAIERLEARLAGREIAHRRLATTHAFHSTMLEPLRERLTRLVGGIQLHAPRIPYISNISGTWITDEQATDPAYWASHMCQTVRFADGASVLLRETNTLLLELGPGQSLSSFVRQHTHCTRERSQDIFSTLPSALERHGDYASLLSAVGKMWLAGASVDWSGLSANQQMRSVVLPNYPFEHQRYWIERQDKPRQKQTASKSGKRQIADWFSLPAWRQVVLTSSELPVREEIRWLFFLDTCAVGKRLIEHFARQRQTVVTVVQGSSFVKYNDEEYAVRPGERADYEALFRELHTAGKLPQKIVHLWTVTAGGEERERDPEAMLEIGFYSLFALTQALGDLDLPACELTVISSGMQNVSGDELVCPEKAAIIGPCRVIPQEYPALTCRSIDIAPPTQGNAQAESLTRQLSTELTAGTDDAVVALRGNRRWVQCFEPAPLAEPEQNQVPLRAGGVYLITGGLGGLGLALGEHLARTVEARLVLVGRNALPPRQTWEQVLAEAGASEHGPARAIRTIQEIEARGSRVLVLRADVTSEEQMRAVVAQTVATFGTLNGVVHAAGVPGMGLLQLKTREQAASVLAPKVQGTRILQRVLAGHKLDFLALCSSITSITGGGPGQFDYAGASAFLDAYAQRYADTHGLTISIDWGEWQWNAWEMGLAGYDAQTQSFLREHRRRYGISFEEGMQAFQRVLAARLPHIVVSPQEIETLLELSKSYTQVGRSGGDPQHAGEKHARPELATSYIAPRNEAERKMAALWGEQLGIEQVGINDNFFELGGNSLIGMDLIRQIRKVFNLVELPPHMLYEAPTVRLIAQHLEQQQTPVATEDKTHERSEKRRERRKQRIQDRKVS